jgi:hypothetical protein
MVFSNVANSLGYAVVPKNQNPTSDQIDVWVFRKKLYLAFQAVGKRDIVPVHSRKISSLAQLNRLIQSCHKAFVFSVSNHPDARVPNTSRDLACPVGGPIIDDQQLPVFEGLFQD